MKPVDVKQNTCIHSSKEINHENSKFKIGDSFEILKYKTIPSKGNLLNSSEEVFVIKKVENTAPLTHLISDVKEQKIVGAFYEKE